MKEKHSLLNIPLYFFLSIICSVPFFIPVFVVFPNLFEGSKSDFVHHLQDNLIFLGANQVASLCGILLATYLIILKIEKSDFYHYKLTIDFKEILKGFLFGTAFFVIIIIGMQLTGVVKFSYSPISTKIIFSFFLYFLVAIGEEVMVRGYILSTLRGKMNNHKAIFVSSLIFGAIHLFNDDFTMIGFLNISLSGFLMGMILVRSNTISTPIGLHWAWNFIQGPIAGFNVSGNKETGIFHIERFAEDYLTGGAFGAEGSLLLIPITITAMYLIWKFNFLGQNKNMNIEVQKSSIENYGIH